MASILDRENLIASHQTTAANKPLNQSLRALQPKTPGNNLKTPFRNRNDENTIIQTGKATKNAFATPGPAPRTAARAPLGDKTANTKAQAFQTPAPALRANKADKTSRKASSARRTIKKKIYVEPEQPVYAEAQAPEQEDEPDSGYAPPPITPLPDPPIEFDYDQSYTALRPENFNRGVGEIYFQSPKDENGFSISLKKIEEADKKSLQRDLDRILEKGATEDRLILDDIEEERLISPVKNTTLPLQNVEQPVDSSLEAQKPNLDTLKSRSAATALSDVHSLRTKPKSHARLPSAATAQTAASKQKRKSTFAVSHDVELSSNSMAPPPMSNITIGFPKARKAPSILPRSLNSQAKVHVGDASQSSISVRDGGNKCFDKVAVSPKNFVELHGRPPVESDMWLQLKSLEIRDRRRGDTEVHEMEEPLFDFDDGDLDAKLSQGFGNDEGGNEGEDFELTLD